jgi:hypothetical protein
VSFWGKLGKIALAAAPIVAAPFTGGGSLLAMGASGGIGAGTSIMSKLAGQAGNIAGGA